MKTLIFLLLFLLSPSLAYGNGCQSAISSEQYDDFYSYEREQIREINERIKRMKEQIKALLEDPSNFKSIIRSLIPDEENRRFKKISRLETAIINERNRRDFWEAKIPNSAE